jgi:hypothetical protein
MLVKLVKAETASTLEARASPIPREPKSKAALAGRGEMRSSVQGWMELSVAQAAQE